jgi:hypothetical protein
MAINFSTNYLTAYNSLTGNLLWRTNLDSVVADKDMKGLVARKSTPSAVVASSVMATPDKMWMIVLSCAKMELSEEQIEKNNMIKIPVRGIPKDSVRIPQRYYLCSFDYNGNLLSKTPAPGDGAMVTAGMDGQIYISALSVVSDIVYNQTPAIFRTTPKPTVGVWAFEPKSFNQQAKEAMRYLVNYCRQDASAENIRQYSDIQRKDIALAQLDGIRISIAEAVERNELNKGKAKEILETLNQPSRFLETGDYSQAAIALEKVVGSF